MDFYEDYTLISYSLKNIKFQASELLLKLCKDQLVLSKKNKDGSTAFGIALTCFRSNDQRSRSRASGIVTLMHDDYSSQIDYHIA